MGDGELLLHGFVDSDWAGHASARKSTLGFCFSLGRSIILWFSRKRLTVALSLAEAASSASCEAIWLSQVDSKVDW